MSAIGPTVVAALTLPAASVAVTLYVTVTPFALATETV